MSSHRVVVPKYHQIFLVLREQILEGRFAGGFPGEHALAEAYGVSRVTLRRAMDALKADGLVARERGRGTRALPATTTAAAGGGSGAKTDISGLLDNIIAYGLRTTARVVELSEIASPPDVARDLRLEAGAPVHKAVRVRSHRGAPMSFVVTHVPAAFAAGIGRRELERRPLLHLLQERGVSIATVRQSIGAELADARVAAELEVQVGSALLAVRRVVSDDADVPVQLLLALYRPDRFEYRMQLSAQGQQTTQVWTAG